MGIPSDKYQIDWRWRLRRAAREFRPANNRVAQVVCTVQEYAWMDEAAFVNGALKSN